jgi:hypothetical protein
MSQERCHVVWSFAVWHRQVYVYHPLRLPSHVTTSSKTARIFLFLRLRPQRRRQHLRNLPGEAILAKSLTNRARHPSILYCTLLPQLQRPFALDHLGKFARLARRLIRAGSRVRAKQAERVTDEDEFALERDAECGRGVADCRDEGRGGFGVEFGKRRAERCGGGLAGGPDAGGDFAARDRGEMAYAGGVGEGAGEGEGVLVHLLVPEPYELAVVGCGAARVGGNVVAV